MATKITVEKTSDDQLFLMFGHQIIGMIINLAGGGWCWCHANPFITGLEAEKEKAGEKLMEFHSGLDIY